MSLDMTLAQNMKTAMPKPKGILRTPVCVCGRKKPVLTSGDFMGTLYAKKCDECKDAEEKEKAALARKLKAKKWPAISRQKRYEFRQSLLACGFPPSALSRRFANFSINNDNEKAFRTAFYLPRAPYRGLLLISDKSASARHKHPLNALGTGIGKTHLIDAVGQAMVARGFLVRYSTTVDLLREIRASFSRNKRKEVENRADDVIERFLSAEVVVLDDLGAEKPSQWVEETIFSLINHLDSHNKILLATSNLELDELEKRIGQRITSRLVKMCHVVKYLDDDWRLK